MYNIFKKTHFVTVYYFKFFFFSKIMNLRNIQKIVYSGTSKNCYDITNKVDPTSTECAVHRLRLLRKGARKK